jgi:Carboxypeptidase regulatory-like domain/TonB-dependent Receptor Plug Domain
MHKRLLFLCLVLGIGVTGFGQSGFGSISGRVTDPGGAVVAGVKVIATNTATRIKSETMTNSSGDYQILQLIPGSYTLEVEAANFKKALRSGITVQVADKLTFDVQLEVGQLGETVTVTTDNSPLLRTADAQQGEVINSTQIMNLPQSNNRDPLELLQLAGNIQGGGGRAGNGSDLRINGGRTQGIQYFVDGIAASTGRSHDVPFNMTPTMDAVAEFKVISNGISAEYGRFSGGVVEIASKYGTNDFHGQVFLYNQQPGLNANSWNNNRLGAGKLEYRQNQFGGALGGPIYLPRIGKGGPGLWSGKNRTFFFFNYEGFRRKTAGQAREASVPTLAERNGDFSNTLVNGIGTDIYDPTGPLGADNERLVKMGAGPLGSCAPVGKCVPAERISPVAKALLATVPLPNKAPSPNSSFRNNYQGVSTSFSDRDTWALRLDHTFTDNQRLFFRYTRLNADSGESRWFSPLQNTPNSKIGGAFGVTLNYDWSISPTLLFNARVGGHYNPTTFGNTIDPSFDTSSIPFDPEVKRLFGRNDIPWVGTTAFNNFADGTRIDTVNSTASTAAASMTKIMNRHTIKFGYEHHRYYDNFLNSARGDYVFQHNPVSRFNRDESWNDQDNANVLAAFLLGLNDKADFSGPTSRAMNFNYHAAYVQDDFKVSRRLTLNLGVRWDMETPTTERYDKLYFWDKNAPSPFTIKPGYNFADAVRAAGLDPSTVRTPEWVTKGFPAGALRIANTPEFPGRYGTKYHPWQFAPRVGAAYQIDDKTVLRASFGQVYFSTAGDPNGLASGGSGVALGDAANAGWHRNIGPGLTQLVSTFENPFKPGDVSSYTRSNQVANRQATGGDPALSAFDRDSRQPYELVWTAGVQRELKGFLVEANYAANLGRRLLGPEQISRFPKEIFVPGNGPIYRDTLVETPANEQTRYGDMSRLAFLEYQYPYYGPATVLGSNVGRSNYQSLNLRAERRLGRGASFLVNYTLSRSMDNVGGPNANQGCICNTATGGRGFQQVDSIRDIYTLSPLDETHRLIVYYNLELPFGRGRKLLGNPNSMGGKAIDFIVGGWDLAGTSSWRSGRPVILANDNVNNDIRVETTFASFASGDRSLSGGNFGGNESVFFGGDDVNTAKVAPNARRLDISKLKNVSAVAGQTRYYESFTYGDVPAVLDGIRHPSSFGHDLSLAKKFPLFSADGSRFLQFRMEAFNLFNMRGFGDYNTDPRDNLRFGLITGPRYTERRVQVSARIVF